MKIVDIFSTIHDPQDWDLISHSDGEYFEVSSSSSDFEDNEIPEIGKLELNSSSSDLDDTFIPDIKMFSFNSSEDLQAKIAAVKAEMAQLDHPVYSKKKIEQKA